jgi:hypothetical protein
LWFNTESRNHLTPQSSQKRGARRARQNKSSGNRVVAELQREEKLSISRFPTRLNSALIFPYTFRFVVNSTISTATVVTMANLLTLWNVVIVSSTVTSQIGAMQIKGIKMWSASTSTGGSTLVSVGAFTGVGVQWFSLYAKPSITEDYGDINRPAHISSRPPRSSLAGDWFSLSTASTSTPMFRLFGAQLGVTGIQATTPLPPGTIIDLAVVMTVFNPGDTAAPVSQTVSTSVVAGGSVFKGLDGLALASSAYTVVGYPQV